MEDHDHCTICSDACPHRLITVPEASARLAVSRATVYRLIKSGEIDSVTVGRSRRVPLAALDHWLQPGQGEQ